MAMKFPFRRILGVEFSLKMHTIAQRNLEQYSGSLREERECRSICEDASSFRFPDEPSVVFMFNPFKADVLSCVIENLRSSFEKRPRHLIFAYVNPQQKNVLDESTFLVQTRSELNGWAVVYETDVTRNASAL